MVSICKFLYITSEWILKNYLVFQKKISSSLGGGSVASLALLWQLLHVHFKFDAWQGHPCSKFIRFSQLRISVWKTQWGVTGSVLLLHVKSPELWPAQFSTFSRNSRWCYCYIICTNLDYFPYLSLYFHKMIKT